MIRTPRLLRRKLSASSSTTLHHHLYSTSESQAATATATAKATMVRNRSSVIASGILLFRHHQYTTSALSTSINLHNPSLLRAPKVTFHRESLEVYDPSASLQQVEDGSAVLALIEAMNRKDVQLAIDKSDKALRKEWKFHTTALHRSGLLSKWSSLIKVRRVRVMMVVMLFWNGKGVMWWVVRIVLLRRYGWIVHANERTQWLHNVWNVHHIIQKQASSSIQILIAISIFKRPCPILCTFLSLFVFIHPFIQYA